MKFSRVYTTDYGQYREEDLPPKIREMLQRAVLRKDGQIDRRYTYGRFAWRLLMAWDSDKFMEGEWDD
jgi:hypothetical protein